MGDASTLVPSPAVPLTAITRKSGPYFFVLATHRYADARFSDRVHLVALFSEVNSCPISLSSHSLPSIIRSSALEVDMSLLRRASFDLASVALL